MINLINPHSDLESKYYALKDFETLNCSGQDCERFLNGQLTNDVSSLKDNQFQGQVRLNRSGQIQAFFYLLKKNSSSYLILINKDSAETLIEDLNKFIIMDDVEISKNNKQLLSLKFSNFSNKGFSGLFAGLNAYFQFDKADEESISKENLIMISDLGGEPIWNRTVKFGQLVTDSFAMLSSVSLKKGCFLGQETVAKIESRRGGSYFPVAMTGDTVTGELYVSDTRVGEVFGKAFYRDTSYTIATLKREYRVEGRLISFDDDKKAKVTYLPLWKSFNLEKFSDDLYSKAVGLFQDGQDNEAIEILYDIIELNPTYTDAYESVGVILGRQERYEDAIELMDQLMVLDDKSVMAHTNKSLYLMKLGKIEEAEEEKAQATLKSFARFGEEAASKKEQERLLEEKKSELMRREQMFKDVLAIDEEDSLANYGLADILHSRGEYQESILYLDKVIKAEPRYSVAYLLLGKSLIKNNLQEKAVSILTEGVKVASKNGDLMPASEMQSLLNELA